MQPPTTAAPENAVQVGLAHFARGDFHAAHEAWEDAWLRNQGAQRELFQALAQLAAAFEVWNRGKSNSAATLFARARGHLAAIPSSLLGVEVSELELQLGAWQEAAERTEDVPAAPHVPTASPSNQAPAAGHRARCPYCGESVDVQAETMGVAEERYVEDCPVCCRPWTVHVTRDGEELTVQLGREDD